MLTAWIVVLVAVVGLVIYALASGPKTARIGEILFAAGTLATLLALATRVIRLP